MGSHVLQSRLGDPPLVNHSHYKTIKRTIFAATVVLHTRAMCPALVFFLNRKIAAVEKSPPLFFEALRAIIGSSFVFMRVGFGWKKIAPRVYIWILPGVDDIFFPFYCGGSSSICRWCGLYHVDKESETAADVSSGRVDAKQARLIYARLVIIFAAVLKYHGSRGSRAKFLISLRTKASYLNWRILLIVFFVVTFAT